jgi:hypothetical protein
MYSDRTLNNRHNVTQDTHSTYRANRDFFLLVLKSIIIAAAMNVLGLQCKISQPTTFQIPKDMLNYSKLEKQKILHEAAGMVVDAFVFDKENISEAMIQ